MTAHRLVIEAGPGSVRRLCCGAGKVSDIAAAALDAIDDPVALVDERPISVDALWSEALRSLGSGHCVGLQNGLQGGVIVVHPSWWSVSRVDLVTAATRGLAGALDAGDVAVHPRSWLLTRAASDNREAVLVEIADQLVVITGPEMVAVSGRTEPLLLAQEVAGVIETTTQGAMVVIDAPGTIAGAALLAPLIADAVRGQGRTVVTIDDAGLSRLAASIADEPCPSLPAAPRLRVGSVVRGAAAGVVLTVVGLAVAAMTVVNIAAPPRAPDTRTAPTTTVLVEGRVALTVPASWLTQRVIAGPGSARVQVTSPSDPEVALHVTQSPTPGETLAAAADRLRHAIDAEPAGLFVDFNPAGISAGRPAVTYREVRTAHDVRWTVLLDGSVRISVGCQSRPGAQDAVRDACEQAVRSAHALE